ncbi:MAG TPA: hypothetical protein IAC63_02865 [Candidatus Enterousia avicola]|uniref:Uncharacterized protein n=1 Tax=Candidatus Enterousia avicola TaxID=2840787 RepID=A0A9D1SMD9_9PROT|nr:hypothetical protein [Candidatus Enterousia avicola]
MGESKKMLHIGFFAVCLVFMLSAILQVCYRTQNKVRNRVRSAIVQTQQDIALAQADFASYVRPEILRNMVTSVYPKTEVIGYRKHISVYDLPVKEETQK